MRLSLLVLGLFGATALAGPPVSLSGPPPAPPLAKSGVGLCASSAISTNPAADFPTSAATFNAGLNAFLESQSATRVTSTLRTVLDLSNNNASGQARSFGDFTDSQSPDCRSGGCDFFVSDTTTSFASRLRGYLSVPPELAGKQLHLAVYADDAVSVTLFDKTQAAYPVILRPPQLGFATWRSTNAVTFATPGLYPIEVLYAEIGEHAALELGLLEGSFTDFELPPGTAGSASLRVSGFSLLWPASFHQTESGVAPYADPAQCAQCNRQFANLPGNGGCGNNYYCNAAALCAPCTSSLFCGPSCSPCGQSTPVCTNVNGTHTCVQCEKDADCGGALKCDVASHTCQECNVDADCAGAGKVCDAAAHKCVACNADGDCAKGLRCDGHACVACSERTACAGASCNCCAGGAATQCAALTPGAPPTCVECTRDGDCAAGKRCDGANGRCVESVAACNTAERCGPQCARCPSERPQCLDGQVCVQCRSDLDCGAGLFCNSGECMPCAVDRRCGLRCASCGGETPYCEGDGTAPRSACVGCRADEDCPGSTCDPTTRRCGSACAASCAPGTHCNGDRCVECYANAHCPCGGSCDLGTFTCSSACTDSADCAPGDHCSAARLTCEPGRRKPGTEPRGGPPCCAAAPAPALLPWVGLALLLAAARRGRRRR